MKFFLVYVFTALLLCCSTTPASPYDFKQASLPLSESYIVHYQYPTTWQVSLDDNSTNLDSQEILIQSNSDAKLLVTVGIQEPKYMSEVNSPEALLKTHILLSKIFRPSSAKEIDDEQPKKIKIAHGRGYSTSHIDNDHDASEPENKFVTFYVIQLGDEDSPVLVSAFLFSSLLDSSEVQAMKAILNSLRVENK